MGVARHAKRRECNGRIRLELWVRGLQVARGVERREQRHQVQRSHVHLVAVGVDRGRPCGGRVREQRARDPSHNQP